MLAIFSILIIAFLTFILVIECQVRKTPKNYPPGPFPLPVVGNAFQLLPNPQIALERLTKQFGRVLSLQLGYYNVVVVSDPKVIREVFTSNIVRGTTDVPYYREGHFYKGKFIGITGAEGQQHAETLKTLKHGLRLCSEPLEKLESMILDEIEEDMEEFKQKAASNHPITSDHLFSVATMSLVWRMMTGTQADRSDMQFTNILKLIHELMVALCPPSPGFFFPWVCKLFPERSCWNTVVRLTVTLGGFLDKLIQRHLDTIKDCKTLRGDNITDVFISKILETEDENSLFHPTYGFQHLRASYISMFNAGSETVAVTLQWALLLLMKTPGLQARLNEEIEEVVGAYRKPSLHDRERMPRMQSFINETLRYSSIVPLALPHALLDDLQINDFIIPKGTIVLPNLYGVAHDEEFWGEDAKDFDPERFLKCNGLNKRNPAFLPFAIGKSKCPGDRIARDQLFLYLTYLLKTFNFTLDTENEYSLEPDSSRLALTPQPFSFYAVPKSH